MSDDMNEVMGLLEKYQDKLQPASGSADSHELRIDSLHLIDLVLAIEEHFGITFPNESMVPETFLTPDSIVKAVQVAREQGRG